MRGAGGSPGGAGVFFFGFALAVGGLWLLLDSVRATTARFGLVSGWLGGGSGEAWGTTSQAIVFVPFLVGVGLLFFNSRWRAGWVVLVLGLILLVVEILSRVRFLLHTKLTLLLLMLLMMAGGVGLMLRALKAQPSDAESA